MTEEGQDPTFSTVTLTRLFRTIAFDNEDTRITQSTLQLSTEYLRMFTREAILRANEVRLREANERARELDVVLEEEVDQSDELLALNTLDTRHLKDVSGLLILDF